MRLSRPPCEKTEQILNNHLKAFAKGDIDTIMDGFAKDAVCYKPDGMLQGDPAQPAADIFFKMQPNTTVPNHWHHSAERMILVSGKMEVNYKGQEPATIAEGMYAYGPPEKPQEASCISNEPCVLFIAFNKPVDAFAVE